MKVLRLALAALAFMGVAHARPAIVEDVAVLARPDASWQYFGRFGVAIDGDFALVSGERYVEDPAAANGLRHEGAALIYRRTSGTTWSYVGPLGYVATITTLTPGLAMKGGVAMTITDVARIWERSGDTWTQQAITGLWLDEIRGPDIEIDGGRIMAARNDCTYSAVILRKAGSSYAVEGDLRGPGYYGCPLYTPVSLDLQGTRALVNDANADGTAPFRMRDYRFGADGWQPDGGIFGGRFEVMGPPLAVAGTHYAFTSDRQFGTSVVYEDGGYDTVSVDRFQAVDQFMQLELLSATAIERIGDLFAQRNYRYDRKGYVIQLFRVNDDAVHSQTHLATLTPRNGNFLGHLLDSSGNRVIVNGYGDTWGDNNVRIFELPASFETPAVQVHDFETPSAGAAWQPAAGSTFSVTRVGTSSVYRQASTVGAPASFLPTSNSRNQSIQADVTLRSFSGNDRWIGLATRRSDDRNYYYVTFRTSGALELKRMVNGTFTTIASAPATLTVGRKYHLRLESIGTLQQVYLDDRLVLSVRDRMLTQGVAGILMNRAAADWDNVIVTPSPFTTILATTFSSTEQIWIDPLSQIQPANGVLNRPAYANSLSFAEGGARTDDQVVQVRIRPVSFNAPENWVGIAARYHDSRNHLFVSLYGRNVISLWRRTNNAVTQLATQRMTVTPGTWYDLRLEVINNSTRVFVNGQQILSSTADPGPANPESLGVGMIALLTSRASADYDDLIAYQP
jgi:hypothetical protein